SLMPFVDLAVSRVRDLNRALHGLPRNTNETHWTVQNPAGQHSIAVGIDAPIEVSIEGHVGYYCAGMNKNAEITIGGNAGVGLAENMMSGVVRLAGDASQAAGATGRGGLLIINGNASARCGISMKGVDIVVKGSIGPMSAFMAQSGALVALGDAGDALGDSISGAHRLARGRVESLGADWGEKPMREEHRLELRQLLDAAGINGAVSVEESR